MPENEFFVGLASSLHDYAKCFTLRGMPLFQVGGVGWGRGINECTTCIAASLDDTDMLSRTGEKGDHLDLPVGEVVSREHRQATIMARNDGLRLEGSGHGRRNNWV